MAIKFLSVLLRKMKDYGEHDTIFFKIRSKDVLVDHDPDQTLPDIIQKVNTIKEGATNVKGNSNYINGTIKINDNITTVYKHPTTKARNDSETTFKIDVGGHLVSTDLTKWYNGVDGSVENTITTFDQNYVEEYPTTGRIFTIISWLANKFLKIGKLAVVEKIGRSDFSNRAKINQLVSDNINDEMRVIIASDFIDYRDFSPSLPNAARLPATSRSIIEHLFPKLQSIENYIKYLYSIENRHIQGYVLNEPMYLNINGFASEQKVVNLSRHPDANVIDTYNNHSRVFHYPLNPDEESFLLVRSDAFKENAFMVRILISVKVTDPYIRASDRFSVLYFKLYATYKGQDIHVGATELPIYHHTMHLEHHVNYTWNVDLAELAAKVDFGNAPETDVKFSIRAIVGRSASHLAQPTDTQITLNFHPFTRMKIIKLN